MDYALKVAGRWITTADNNSWEWSDSKRGVFTLENVQACLDRWSTVWAESGYRVQVMEAVRR